MPGTRLKRLILGEPLASYQARHERIPRWKALSTLSSDALSSVAYATDAMLFVLVGFSAAAVVWSIPIALAIVGLLLILTASYRQTIEAYPGGGGAYTVAKDNLGPLAAQAAGAALLIDYALTVAVSIAAGVENVASALPVLHDHRVGLCLAVVAVVMFMNLRGVRDSASLFAIPAYFFIFSVAVLLCTGAYQLLSGEAGAPAASPLTALPEGAAAVPVILMLRAFASGCAALTGIEAISNGVPLFKEPAHKNAKSTLLWMSAILGAMFLGITVLAYFLQLLPHENETLISILGRRVFGETWQYYLLQLATALILFLAANTAYAGFPRLSSILARDRLLPRQLMSLGDRLVFSNGVVGLSVVACILLVLFRAETVHLLPLYALGVFLSFTLSQAGMVVHHLRDRQHGWVYSLCINALGTVTTLVVLIDITMTKFLHGAWFVIFAIPFMVLVFRRIQAHYASVGRELSGLNRDVAADFKKIRHTVVVPVSGIHQGVFEAIQYALTISEDVRCCYVDLDSESTSRMEEQWKRWAPHIPFVVLKSPYRSIIGPLIRYVDDVEECSHDDMVTVVIPEFVTARWWHQLLHNHTAIFIRAAFAFRRRKVVTSVRYHLRGF